MDNAKVIEELDIIIRARVEEARSEIKKVAKDVKNSTNEISKSVQQIAKDTSLDEFRNKIKQVIQDCENIEVNTDIDDVKSKLQELEKLRDELVGKGTIFHVDEDEKMLDDLIQKIMEARDVYSSLNMDAVNQGGDSSPTQESDGAIHLDSGNSKQEISSIRTEMQKLVEEASKLEINGLDPYEVLNIKDAMKLLANETVNTIPAFSNLKNSIQTNLESGDSVLSKLSASVGFLANNVSSKFQDMETKMGDFKSSIQSSVDGATSKFTPLFQVAKNTSTVLGRISGVAKGALDGIKTTKPVKAIQSLISKLKSVPKETEKVKKSTNGLSSSIGKSFSSGVKSIKKFALSLLSVRTAFSAISKASQAYLSFDTQLNDSIQNSWNTLGSLLAPVLETVASLFSKVTSAVAKLVQSLTGIDLVAKANAKALDTQAKSATNASKSLSSIDDISTLSSSSSSGDSETAQITTEDIDITPLESFANKAKEIFSKLFDPMKEAWDSVGSSLISSITTAFQSIGTVVGNIFDSFMSVWENGTGLEFCTNILLIVQQIFDFVSGISGAFSSAWETAGLGTEVIQTAADALNGLLIFIQSLGESITEICTNGTLQTTFALLLSIATSLNKIFGGIFNAITKAWKEGENGTSIFQSVADIFNDILEFGDSIYESIEKWVISDGFQEALNKVFGGISDIFGIAKEVCDWLLKMYETYVKPVIDEKLLPAINDIVSAVMDVWNAVEPVVKWVIQCIENVLEPVIQGLMGFISGIIDVVKGIAQFISGVFTGDWDKAWNGIKNIFVGIWEAIWGTIKGILNSIIAGFENLINTVIKGLNLLFKPLRDIGNGILSLVGINISIPEISTVSLPRLESGHVAYEPIIAEIGEYANAKSDPEIVSPVSMMKGAFKSAMSEYGDSGTRIDKLVIDVAGKNFYDDFIEYLNDKNTRRGVSVLKGEM